MDQPGLDAAPVSRPGMMPGSMIRAHRVPFSTNVERVALAAGHKGVAVEWVDHDPDDRTAIVSS